MTRTEICLSEQLETSASASEIIQGEKTYQNLSQDGFFHDGILMLYLTISNVFQSCIN